MDEGELAEWMSLEQGRKNGPIFFSGHGQGIHEEGGTSAAKLADCDKSKVVSWSGPDK